MSYSIRNSFNSYDEHGTCVVKINVLLHIYGNFIDEYCDDDSVDRVFFKEEETYFKSIKTNYEKRQ